MEMFQKACGNSQFWRGEQVAGRGEEWRRWRKTRVRLLKWRRKGQLRWGWRAQMEVRFNTFLPRTATRHSTKAFDTGCCWT